MQNKITIKNKIYNYFMLNGHKNTCEKILIKNVKKLQKNNKKNHLSIIKLSIINTTPAIQLRQIKKKKRKSLKEFSYVLNQKNRISLGIKQIVEKTRKTNTTNLFNEFLSLSQKTNELLKNKENKLKIALTKKKYIFFRWFY